MSNIVKHYSGKDAEMLVTVASIIDAAISHKAFLQSERSIWADPYFSNVKTKIDTAVKKHLGIENAKTLRQALVAVFELQNNAFEDVAELKSEIQENFRLESDVRDKLIENLGFKEYFKTAQKNDEESLVNLLFQIKANLTSDLKKEFVSKGISAALLDRLVAYCAALKKSNVTNETFKASRYATTDEALQDFNEIFDTGKSIAKISSTFFREQKAIQALFDYKKVRKSLLNFKK